MAVELPDFEELQKYIEVIGQLALAKSLLDIKIRALESDIFRIALVKPELQQGGKPPSATFIESAYKYAGLEGELIPLRKELAKITTTLETKRLTFELLKDKIEVWRSEQANQRVNLTV